MMLNERYILFEDNCRKLFVGEIIKGIIYGEVNYNFEDFEDEVLEPFYFTNFRDIDSLDHSVYFETNNKTIYVFWDSTFFSYGISAEEIDLNERPNDYEVKWDVSNEEKWINLLGQRIVDFKVKWEQVYTTNIDGENKECYTYPQAFVIQTENETKIIISASEFKNLESNEVYGMMDNLLVTTNYALAEELKIV